MKKTNKIVSLVLALVMILSIMPYGVFAEEDNGVENNPVVGIEPQAPPSDEEVEETTVAVPSEPTEIEPKAENRTEATPEKELAAAKTNAKAEIEATAKAKNDAIDKLTDVSDNAKNNAKAEVNTAVTNAKAEIDNADSIEKVEEAKNEGIKAIDEIKLPEADLDTVKNNAKAEIDATAKNKKDSIDGVDGAKADDIKTAKAKVDAAVTKAKTDIDNATTITEVDTARTNGIKAIDEIKLPEADLDTVKNNAKAEIDAAAIAKKDAIDKLTNVSSSEKTKAKNSVDELAKNGKTTIDAQDTIAKVNTEKTKIINAINAVTPTIIKLEITNVYRSGNYIKGKVNVPYATVYFYREDGSSAYASDEADKDGYFEIYVRNVYRYDYLLAKLSGYTNSEEYTFGRNWSDWDDDDYYREREIYPTSIRVSNDGYKVSGYTNYRNTRVYAYYDGRAVGNGYTDSDGYFNFSTDRKVYNDSDLRFYIGSRSTDSIDKEIYPTSIRVSNDGYRVTGYTNYKNTRVYVYYDGSSVGNGTTDRDGYFSISTDRKIYNDKYLRFYIAGTSTDDEKLEQLSRIAYIKGYPDGTFKPNSNMTRAEAVTMFARLIKG
ncbi:MAG: DUF1542 domain-containing protein [Tissierellia bacterium]|nr:DUF1542 domain-containing protein [Tissierellia bacterium]